MHGFVVSLMCRIIAYGVSFADLGVHFGDLGVHFGDLGVYFGDLGLHFGDLGIHFAGLDGASIPNWYVWGIFGSRLESLGATMVILGGPDAHLGAF